MEAVATGFKQTKIGEMPEEWSMEYLGNVASITRLAGYEYSEYWEESEEGEIIALRGYNIGKGRIILRDIAKISNDLSLKLIRSRLSKGDVVYPCVGTIGNASVIKENDKFHIQQNIAKISCRSNCDPYYLVQFLMSGLSLKEVMRFSASSSQPNVLVGSLRQYCLRVPPLPEQKKIAEILSTVDEAIEQTQSIIAETQKLKKGLMQHLFTKGIGHTKFKQTKIGEIPEEWCESRLDELCDSKMDFIDGDWIESPYIEKDGIRLIQTGNIGIGEFKNKSKNYVSHKTFKELKCKEVLPNDLLICRLASPIGRSCIVPNTGERFITSVDVTITRPNPKFIEPVFLSYFLNHYPTLGWLNRQGGGVAHQRISRKNLGKLNVPLPPLPEQKKIAKILSEVDNKIEEENINLKELQNLKKGLMQVLLTGKVRVK